jgi:hypothetical protein
LVPALAAALAGCGGGGTAGARRAAGPPPTGLKASGKVGLLGAPLPEGARLVDWAPAPLPGEPAGQRGRFERYEIDAPAGDVADFFSQAMPGAGWANGGRAAPGALAFRKGGLTLTVQVKDGGGAFTLTTPPAPAGPSGIEALP